ncbi:unnamed protein product, partial [Ixodes pacificus]
SLPLLGLFAHLETKQDNAGNKGKCPSRDPEGSPSGRQAVSWGARVGASRWIQNRNSHFYKNNKSALNGSNARETWDVDERRQTRGADAFVRPLGRRCPPLRDRPGRLFFCTAGNGRAPSSVLLGRREPTCGKSQRAIVTDSADPDQAKLSCSPIWPTLNPFECGCSFSLLTTSPGLPFCFYVQWHV